MSLLRTIPVWSYFECYILDSAKGGINLIHFGIEF